MLITRAPNDAGVPSAAQFLGGGSSADGLLQRPDTEGPSSQSTGRAQLIRWEARRPLDDDFWHRQERLQRC